MTIKDARKKVGWTQKQLSERLGIPHRTIQSWEGNQRSCPPYVERLVVEEILRHGETPG